MYLPSHISSNDDHSSILRLFTYGPLTFSPSGNIAFAHISQWKTRAREVTDSRGAKYLLQLMGRTKVMHEPFS